jgi:predicted RNase H-like HicB family nuclease
MGRPLESALEAARDLVGLWLEELRERGEPVPESREAVLGSIEVA